MKPETWLYIIIAIPILSFIWDEIVSYLNLQHRSADLPKPFQGKFDAERYAKGLAYHKTNYRFGILSGTFSLLLTLAALYFGWFGWLDAQVREITTHFIWLPLIFLSVLVILSDIINTPFQIYRTFVIEEKFGFNRTTVRTFILDKIKGVFISGLIGGLMFSMLLWLIESLGQDFWIWFWIFATAITTVMMMFYTSWILPLFNKLTPLEDGELRESIEAYSQQVAFPLDNIFVMDGSKRSSKANAFFSGLGKRKKIVLYDTLVENHSKEELVAVLAHEVGHYKKKHTLQGLAISILQTGLMLFILSRFILSTNLSQALGGTEQAAHLNLLAFGFIYSPVSLIIGLLMNLFSRKNEFEADAYAAQTYDAKPLQSALLKLSEENMSNLTPHPLYVFMHYSHPPLLQRLEAMQRA